MFPWQGLPRWANVFFWRCFRFGVERAKPTMDAARSRMGLPPLRSLWHHLVDVPFFLACDPVLAPAPPDWSARPITATGPWFYDDPGELAPEVEEFLAAGPAPVYVGFGSMVSDDVAGVTRAIVEGAGAHGRRVLLSKGWAGLGEGELPAYAKVVHGPMPHAKLFPRMAAVVHHGGSGTTANALRAGVPQVIVPHIMDQFYYAERLFRLGLAPRGIPAKRLTGAKLAQALDATLALDPAPRRAMAKRLRAGDGIARAIAILEGTVKNRGQTTFFRGAENRGLSPVS
jgi:vancomycin aglycone glucosyltransferase